MVGHLVPRPTRIQPGGRGPTVMATVPAGVSVIRRPAATSSNSWSATPWEPSTLKGA
jgi:hypothetical protein